MAAGLNVKDMKLYAGAASILADMAARGFADDAPLDLNILSQLDQLHYHGVASVQSAIDQLGYDASDSILEVGAGWGGPSRFIAAQSGARVTALELQDDFSTVGAHLTERCGLSTLVAHHRGDFHQVDFGGAQFDHVVSWLALYHIPDRPTYSAKIRDVLVPGGTLFIEDLMQGTAYAKADKNELNRELFANSLVSESDYISGLEALGFEIISADNMTADWTAFTAQRLEMFHANKDTFTAIHGEALFEEKGHFYTKIVEYFTASAIGGIRLAARRV